MRPDEIKSRLGMEVVFISPEGEVEIFAVAGFFSAPEGYVKRQREEAQRFERLHPEWCKKVERL